MPSKRYLVVTKRNRGYPSADRMLTPKRINRARLVPAPKADQRAFIRQADPRDTGQVLHLADKGGNIYGTFVRRPSPIPGRPASYEDVGGIGYLPGESYTPIPGGEAVIRTPEGQTYIYRKSNPTEWARGEAIRYAMEP